MAISNSNPSVLSATTLLKDKVVNSKGEELGKIEEFMIDLASGRIIYAVLSFGGFLGMGSKLFAVPWEALKLDTENKRFVLDVDKERLKDAPGFDKNDWPNQPDVEWLSKVYTYYGASPYWKDRS